MPYYVNDTIDFGHIRPQYSSAAFSGDPYFSNVVLLLNMQGANGSTSFTDNSPLTHSVSANSGATISNTTSPFSGKTSAHLPGSSSAFLSIPDNAEFALGSLWTLETWVYITSWVNATNYVSWGGQRDNNTSAWYWHVFNGQGGGYGSALEYRNSGGSVVLSMIDTDAGDALSLNTWTYLAIVHTGTQINSYKDGVLVRTVSTTAAIGDNPGALTIGRLGFSGEKYDGYIGPTRITKGVARTVTSVPTDLFPTS